jgi:hypothetical protein
VVKVPQAIAVFKELIQYYGVMEIFKHISTTKITNFDVLKKSLSAKIQPSQWLNIGGQLIRKEEVDKLKRDIVSGKIKSWDEIHNFYKVQGELYSTDKLNHAYTSLLEILNITPKQFTPSLLKELLFKAIATKEWMYKGIYDSKAKDYSNPFRKMVYETNTEMNNVLGKLEDNTFIQEQLAELDTLKKQVKASIKKLAL